jgi:hypothetical protein
MTFDKNRDYKTLYSTDYVLVHLETQKPIESYDIINHYTSVIDEFNLQLTNNGVEYIPMTRLTREEQNKYLNAMKGNK